MLFYHLKLLASELTSDSLIQCIPEIGLPLKLSHLDARKTTPNNSESVSDTVAIAGAHHRTARS